MFINEDAQFYTFFYDIGDGAMGQAWIDFNLLEDFIGKILKGFTGLKMKEVNKNIGVVVIDFDKYIPEPVDFFSLPIYLR